jgi:hypothetical protein
VCGVRVAKTTKEIDVDELEQLTKPEARATAAFDARELQGLLDQSRRDDDDLEIPIAPLPAASTPASSTPIPKLTAPPPLTKPESMKRPARASSLVPWIVVALSAAVIVALAFWR